MARPPARRCSFGRNGFRRRRWRQQLNRWIGKDAVPLARIPVICFKIWIKSNLQVLNFLFMGPINDLKKTKSSKSLYKFIIPRAGTHRACARRPIVASPNHACVDISRSRHERINTRAWKETQEFSILREFVDSDGNIMFEPKLSCSPSMINNKDSIKALPLVIAIFDDSVLATQDHVYGPWLFHGMPITIH